MQSVPNLVGFFVPYPYDSAATRMQYLRLPYSREGPTHGDRAFCLGTGFEEISCWGLLLAPKSCEVPLDLMGEVVLRRQSPSEYLAPSMSPALPEQCEDGSSFKGDSLCESNSLQAFPCTESLMVKSIWILDFPADGPNPGQRAAAAKYRPSAEYGSSHHWELWDVFVFLPDPLHIWVYTVKTACCSQQVDTEVEKLS